jgi:hypothetical protein
MKVPLRSWDYENMQHSLIFFFIESAEVKVQQMIAVIYIIFEGEQGYSWEGIMVSPASSAFNEMLQSRILDGDGAADTSHWLRSRPIIELRA